MLYIINVDTGELIDEAEDYDEAVRKMSFHQRQNAQSDTYIEYEIVDLTD